MTFSDEVFIFLARKSRKSGASLDALSEICSSCWATIQIAALEHGRVESRQRFLFANNSL